MYAGSRHYALGGWGGGGGGGFLREHRGLRARLDLGGHHACCIPGYPLPMGIDLFWTHLCGDHECFQGDRTAYHLQGVIFLAVPRAQWE